MNCHRRGIDRIFFLLYIPVIFSICQIGLSVWAQSSTPSDLPAICSDFLPSVPAENFKEFLEVPEDWSDPAKSPKIRIFFYSNFPKEETLQASFRPTVFFEGGPGADSHSSYFAYNGSPSSLRDLTGYRPLIFIDARGTGCSGKYPSDSSRVVKYGTRAIVKDAEAVREYLQKFRARNLAQKLGLKLGQKLSAKKAALKWQVLGHSFGGYVAYRYLTMYPENLLKVFVHGAAIVDDWSLYQTHRLIGQNRVLNEGYFSEYPQDRDRLIQVRAKLRGQFSSETEREALRLAFSRVSSDDPSQYQLSAEGICFSSSEGTEIHACGEAVLESLVYPMSTRANWPAVHDLIVKSLDVDGLFQPFYFGSFMNRLVFPSFKSNPLAVQLIWRHELTNPQSSENICQVARVKLARFDYNDFKIWPINECRLLEGNAQGPLHIKTSLDQEIVKSVDQMTTFDPLTLSQVEDALKRNPKLDLFVFSGGRDAFFSRETYQQQAARLGARMKFYSLTSESGGCGFQLGHGDYGRGKDLWAAIDGANLEKDPSCEAK